MKKVGKKFITLVSAGIFVFGCSPVEEKNSEATNNLVVNNDPTELSQHITTTEEDVVVVDVPATSSKPGLQKSTKLPDETTLTLIAEVDSPVYEGVTLQATEVIYSGNTAYVSYNVAGDEYLGAIDIIKINNAEKPQLTSRMIFSDSDIHAIERVGKTLYLAAGTSDSTYESPAVLKVVHMGNKHSFDTKTYVSTFELPSYAATDVDVLGDYIYVSSGAVGGAISILERKNVNFNSRINIEDPRGLSSWRGSGEKGVSIIAGGNKIGTSAKLILVDENNPTEEQSRVPITGATIEQAKATVERNKKITLLAAGEGGMQVICNTDNTQTGYLAAPTGIKNSAEIVLDSEKTVTNAASASGRFVYMANGEAGVYMAKIDGKFDGNSCDMTGLEIVGKLQLGDGLSANHVTAKKDLLFVASGLGGLKIVRINDSSIDFDDEDDEDTEDEYDDDFDYDSGSYKNHKDHDKN